MVSTTKSSKPQVEFSSDVIEMTCNQFTPKPKPLNYDEWKAAKIKSKSKYS